MKYTDEQIYKAFMDAADYIEANPDKYNFDGILVPPDGGCGCMWGHTGKLLGFKQGICISEVAEMMKLETTDLYDSHSNNKFCSDPNEAAKAMRLFAKRFKDKGIPDNIREIFSESYRIQHTVD